MLKRCFSGMALVSIFLLSLCSCSDEEAVRPTAGRSVDPGDDDWIEEELRKAPELRELLSIRDELAVLAITRGVTPREIRETVGDAVRSNALLGLGPEEADARFERIDELMRALFARYPALEDAAREAAPCPTCDAESVAAAWEHYSRTLPAALGTAGLSAAGATTVLREPGAPARQPAHAARAASSASCASLRPPLTCKMTQLIVGFGLCALKSGGSLLFYSICAYGIFCSACDGGVADVICP